MNKITRNMGIGLISILLGITLFVTGFTTRNNEFINDAYKVYLKGKEIGIISSKNELNDYINKKQEELKKKFSVKEVYAPKGLDIVPYKTYSNKIISVDQVYNAIENIEPFTIRGYKIIIKKIDDEKKVTGNKNLYVLNKEDFISSVKKVVNTFVNKDDYELYLNDNQVEIKETGSIIEDVYLSENITIKEDNISVNEDIFLNEDDLTKQLLFGTTKKQKTYVVKSGDNIEDVSFNNQLNPQEFLVANPEFTSVNNLLYAGQEVVIGLINPQISVVSKTYVVSDKERQYTTEIKYDDNSYVGNSKEIQKGENGLDRVSQRLTYVNGEITTVDTINSVELKPTVNEVIEKGSKTYYPTSSGIVQVEGNWAWPTTPGYMITSYFAWRWGKMHQGIDIAGCGLGSNIYAVNNGIVVRAGKHGSSGIEIVLDHGNGYYTEYAHLSRVNVTAGQTVSYGQVIGGMGKTGFATGVHLHFGLWKGFPFKGTAVNPLSLYK